MKLAVYSIFLSVLLPVFFGWWGFFAGVVLVGVWFSYWRLRLR
jgi:hypothetical protein